MTKNIVNCYKKMVLGLLFLVLVLNTGSNALGTSSSAEEFLYASYYGGSELDTIIDVAVDSEGNIVIVGGTFSEDLPILNPFQINYGGGDPPTGDEYTNGGDGFIFKLDQDGSILWASYIGGSDIEVIDSIDIDDNDNIFICGGTSSQDFPVTENAYQPTYGGGDMDGFFAKISPVGILLYSSYFGGNESDQPSDSKVDNEGNFVILGSTTSPNLNTTENAYQTSFGGIVDAFILKFSSSLTLEMCSYWGAADYDSGANLEIDSADNIYVSGNAMSTNFPLQDPLDDQVGGSRDIYITKFSAAGNVEFSTFLGGDHIDDAFGSAIDPQGNLLLTGRTASLDYPILDGNQTEHAGGEMDGMISVLDSNGQSLRYSSYYGGPGWDTILDIAVSSSGKIIACGFGERSFPQLHPLQEFIRGRSNLVIMAMNSDYSLAFSSYFANSGGIFPRAIEDFQGQMIIGGRTIPDALPVSDDAEFPTNLGGEDGFLIKFDIDSYLESLNSSSTIGNVGSFFYMFSILGIVSVMQIKKRHLKSS
jgi:hypothetical protein